MTEISRFVEKVDAACHPSKRKIGISGLQRAVDYKGRRNESRRIFLAALTLSLTFAPALAQETCESKAVSKEGKPLVGAAKNSFLKKCKRDFCVRSRRSAATAGRSPAPPRRASCRSVSEKLK